MAFGQWIVDCRARNQSGAIAIERKPGIAAVLRHETRGIWCANLAAIVGECCHGSGGLLVLAAARLGRLVTKDGADPRNIRACCQG